jgi:Methyltransferase domain
MKIDLGAGPKSPEGFTPMGNGHELSVIFPLPFNDNSVDEVRASHVLEHFAHGRTDEVLKEWARVLKPGGFLKIAVPNFEKIAEQHVGSAPQNTLGYVMGGQTDEADFHKTIFDANSLKKALGRAGLMLSRPWVSELPDDCAALSSSLNLQATKPYMTQLGVSGVMSVPRLGFMDNFFVAMESLGPLKVKLRSHTGAFWDQCMERAIDRTLREENPDAVLSLDYDSVFRRQDAAMLMQLMMCHPEADAIAPVQAGRGIGLGLFTVKDEDGENIRNIPVDYFAPDLSPVATGNFGLTLFRADKLREFPKPWLWSQPAEDGSWGPGHIDADIFFWNKWREQGNSLFLANRVVIGHLELMVAWPQQNGHSIYQTCKEWRENGKPEGAWQ